MLGYTINFPKKQSCCSIIEVLQNPRSCLGPPWIYGWWSSIFIMWTQKTCFIMHLPAVWSFQELFSRKNKQFHWLKPNGTSSKLQVKKNEEHGRNKVGSSLVVCRNSPIPLQNKNPYSWINCCYMSFKHNEIEFHKQYNWNLRHISRAQYNFKTFIT